jgi:hypothetical protein
MRSGYIPLSWLLAPEKYGERRSARREAKAPTDRRDSAVGI